LVAAKGDPATMAGLELAPPCSEWSKVLGGNATASMIMGSSTVSASTISASITPNFSSGNSCPERDASSLEEKADALKPGGASDASSISFSGSLVIVRIPARFRVKAGELGRIPIGGGANHGHDLDFTDWHSIRLPIPAVLMDFQHLIEIWPKQALRTDGQVCRRSGF
jgi:hypothetical protein